MQAHSGLPIVLLLFHNMANFWRIQVKLLLNKIRGLLERARNWNAHEDGAPDRVG